VRFWFSEDGDDEDEDDIIVGGATQDYKCPITLRVFENPVTSYALSHPHVIMSVSPFLPILSALYAQLTDHRTKCPHSFSRNAIYSMFRVPEIRCPQPGCQARFTKADLRANRNLEDRVKAFARREKERERREREKEDDIDMTLDDDDDE
jgi:E3 SUMO-protein ligase NSE2